MVQNCPEIIICVTHVGEVVYEMWYFWKTSDWKWCLFENIFLRCNQILAPPFRFKDRTKFILQFWNCQNNICVAPSLVSGWQRWPDPSVHCCTLSLCHLGSDDHHRNPNTNTKVILWATNCRLIKHQTFYWWGLENLICDSDSQSRLATFLT